jgi:hypothetical protein
MAVVVLVSVGPTDASEKFANQCVQHVIDKLDTGELVLSEPECYRSFTTALTAEGVDAWGPGAYEKAQTMAADAVWVLGKHYDGGSLGGESAVVVGDACDGGWINVSAEWNNRISSTEHGCPRIKHFNGGHITGTSETTYSPWENLSTLNNMTSSIQYLT